MSRHFTCEVFDFMTIFDLVTYVHDLDLKINLIKVKNYATISHFYRRITIYLCLMW